MAQNNDPRLAVTIDTLAEKYGMTVRVYNCLQRNGLHTVGAIVSETEGSLLDIRNFGINSLEEMKAILTALGGDPPLSLKPEPPKTPR